MAKSERIKVHLNIFVFHDQTVSIKEIVARIGSDQAKVMRAILDYFIALDKKQQADIITAHLTKESLGK